MVKLRAPDGISSIVHDGVEVEIGDDRSVEVDDLSAEVFKVHGFRPWNDCKSAVLIDAVPHSQMVLHLLERPRRPLDDLPAESHQANLPATASDTVVPPDDAARVSFCMGCPERHDFLWRGLSDYERKRGHSHNASV